MTLTPQFVNVNGMVIAPLIGKSIMIGPNKQHQIQEKKTVWRRFLITCFPPNWLLVRRPVKQMDMVLSPPPSMYRRTDSHIQWKRYKKAVHQGPVSMGTLFSFETNTFSLPPDGQRTTVLPQTNNIHITG